MDTSLPAFDIYKGTVASSCFKNHNVNSMSQIFSKKVMFDVRSEIHLIRSNIVSTGQSARALNFRSEVSDHLI